MSLFLRELQTEKYIFWKSGLFLQWYVQLKLILIWFYSSISMWESSMIFFMAKVGFDSLSTNMEDSLMMSVNLVFLPIKIRSFSSMILPGPFEKTTSTCLRTGIDLKSLIKKLRPGYWRARTATMVLTTLVLRLIWIYM